MKPETQIAQQEKKTAQEIKWGGLINEFLWTCAGVNKKILRQCVGDYAKYAGIGGTILFTAIMAAISGGYAISFVFQEAPLYVPFTFGIIWGLLIFNLDRFMVNTMYSDGKHTISKAEFFGGLPRIILAIFLGIVISTPLEIRVFQDKINSQLIIDQGKVGDDIRAAHNALYERRIEIEKSIATRNNQLSSLKAGKIDPSSSAKVAKLEDILYETEMKLYEETNGTGVTKERGYGTAAKQLQATVDRLKNEIRIARLEERQYHADNLIYIKEREKIVQKEIDEYKRQLKELQAKIEETENQGYKSQRALTGFCAQINALNEITAPTTNIALFYARLFITLLFVAIEVIPTLFKMMISDGPYDDLLNADKHRVKVLSQKQISDINDDINTAVQISTQKNKERLEAEILANKEIMTRIAAVQAELLQTAIDTWRAEELEKIKQNPSLYIKSNNNPDSKTSTTE